MSIPVRSFISSVRRVFLTNSRKAILSPRLVNSPLTVLSSARMSSSSSFQKAVERLKTLKEEPGSNIKLNLYGLYKQSTEGTCKQSKPSMFDMIKKAKYDAWSGLGNMSQEEAQKKYILLVDELCGAESNSQPSEGESTSASNKYEGISYSVGEHITEIVWDRPNKKNAITTGMYKDMILALKEAAENDTAVTLLTGRGDFYSSGNDLSNFANISGDIAQSAERGAVLLKEFVNAFIDFPKVLVAAVNGPAVGIPVTLLGLCDVVYASDKATFHTPFSTLGQTPEGCSTYTFPKIMGYSKANEILFFSKKITAKEAQTLGLVSDVFPHDTFMDCVKEKLSFLPDASGKSMIYSKALHRDMERSILHKVNDAECKRLIERWQSPDCMEAIMKFFQRKSKL